MGSDRHSRVKVETEMRDDVALLSRGARSVVLVIAGVLSVAYRLERAPLHGEHRQRLKRRARFAP
jgi:hypothetical protein